MNIIFVLRSIELFCCCSYSVCNRGHLGLYLVTTFATGDPYKQCVCLCSKYKEMYGRILKSLNIVNLYRGMSKLKLKINVNLPQLLCIVVFVALNGEFGRFGGFCVDCYYTL